MAPAYEELARRAGVEDVTGRAEKLRRYAALVLRDGPRLSLLARGDLSERALLEKHFADAVEALLFADPARDARVLDFGAGAGVVGVAWSLLRPEIAVTLAESRHGKALFLKRCVAALSLGNVFVWEGRGEEAGGGGKRFDVVAVRGVAMEQKGLDAAAAILSPLGALLLFKGPESAPAAAARIAEDGRFTRCVEQIRPLGGGKKRIYLLARLGASPEG